MTEAAKKTYTCTRNVDFGTSAADAKRYEEKDSIELEDKDAGPLLECGAIVDPSAPAAKPAKTAKKK